MARGLVAVSLALATFTLAPSARATDVPKYDQLPVGRLTTAPTASPPSSIPARERVTGLFVTSPKFAPEVPVRARHVTVVGDQTQADAIRKGDNSGSDRESGACFSDTRSPNRALDEDDPEAHEWSYGQTNEANIWHRSKDNQDSGTSAVHSERLVEESGNVRLESIDAWVDPTTQGARLIARASLPLVLVGTAVGGVKVYAGRDQREVAGPRFVQFVVVRPATVGTSRAGLVVAIRQDGNRAHGSGCGHLRIPLAVDPKNADSAVVTVPVELPALDAAAKDRAAPPVVTADAAPAESPPPVTTFKVKRHFKGRRRPPPPTPLAPGVVEREARTRDVQVHLGVSQTTRDKEPMVAVSFGWANRESVQRVTEEPPAAPHD